FIENADYANTNNIYSAYLAKDFLIQDDTILLESDLIYETNLIKKVVECPDKDLAVVAKYESWMDGTVVTCLPNGNIEQFIDKADMDFSCLDKYYKTVNIYKFSKEFSKNIYMPFLEAYMQAYGKNSYYETVLKVVAHLAKSHLKAFFMDDIKWYEIDDAQDLDIANVLFSNGKHKYDLVISKFGGYWRYPRMLDFCYLVNPFFPSNNFIQKMGKQLEILITHYPSGLAMQNLNAERIFGVDMSNIIVGNGAAELISALGAITKGKVAVSLPTFNEYVRCFKHCDFIRIDNSQWDYNYNLDYLLKIIPQVDCLCVVSPDNPSGALIPLEEILLLAQEAQKANTRLVIDESFIDFADKDKRYTLFNNDILDKYPSLCVIKSISKSYGVPGLRLGVLASGDKELLSQLSQTISIWNINSFAEYFLQIFNLYQKEYIDACDKIAQERNRFIKELSTIKSIKVYPSQANYLMIDLGQTNSYQFCVEMLEDYNIFIKDLSSKAYFEGKNYIRVSIRNTEDNNAFIKAIKEKINV
ncbi:MAG TPA: aminotransferase class I/II-fold pyridoxal phosphate-dependent enzyme, partial [Clostridia bacterium]